MVLTLVLFLLFSFTLAIWDLYILGILPFYFFEEFSRIIFIGIALNP